MFAILMLLVLAINGGLFTGTIAYSAMQTARHDYMASIAESFLTAPRTGGGTV